jgi:hypothetical protein
MDKLAYDIKSAAEATSLSEHAISLAVREGRLSARILDGVHLILRTDIQCWLESLAFASVANDGLNGPFRGDVSESGLRVCLDYDIAELQTQRPAQLV